MKIELKHISVRDLTKGYYQDEENGHVEGYGGRLNIRPEYQREFVYKDKQRNAVIDTILKGFPLNVMYWAKCADGNYEVIDGQQRTISVCQYVTGQFSMKIDENTRFFHNLEKDVQDRILDYELMVYICDGEPSEKIAWFRIINIAGEQLTDQELLNAIYHGPWVNDAKLFFSKSGGPAARLGGDYLEGSVIRQDYLATAIKWISGGLVEMYMDRHQSDINANELKAYFRNVIEWIEDTFKPKDKPAHKKIMKGVDWGELYDRYKEEKIDLKLFDEDVDRLLLDDDVTNKKGIYPYLLTGKEKCLSIRAFSEAQKLAAYTRQGGVCKICGKQFKIEEMEADHITPWVEGGRTVAENCQMLCRECNRRKSSK